jgi:hypothetical protein
MAILATLLVVDGYHRVEAAKSRGADMIDAAVRHGSRQDALDYAAHNNAVSQGELLAVANGQPDLSS